MRQFRAVSELPKDKIICDAENFFLFLASLICLPSIFGDNGLVGGLVSYGEILAEWHEGSPDWAFGPPSI